FQSAPTSVRSCEDRRSINFGIDPLLRKQPIYREKRTRGDFAERGDKIGYHQLLPFIGFGSIGSMKRCFCD
ncbi:hypothetical protein WBQ28_10235, partial [Pseudomonas syringae pv. syringae]|uniref:hypothetical protein n=1 Tax=Pseudomonas syringae TaxID=317 RepID=UPI003B00DA42